MIRVLFTCSAGISTALLVSKVKALATTKGIDLEIEALSEAETLEHALNIDVLLMGPQVRHLEPEMKTLVGERNIQVAVVDMRAYGTMNAQAVLDQIQSLHAKNPQ